MTPNVLHWKSRICLSILSDQSGSFIRKISKPPTPLGALYREEDAMTNVIARLTAELASLKKNGEAVEAAKVELRVAKVEREDCTELFELAVSMKDFTEADKAAAEMDVAQIRVANALEAFRVAVAKPHSKSR